MKHGTFCRLNGHIGRKNTKNHEPMPSGSHEAAVRSRLSPSIQYNPNLLPIGQGSGFIVSMEEMEDW